VSEATVDVVVVGGGFAGLRAAAELVAAGAAVTLLEARDRLGGRTWTVGAPGTDDRIELGGGFFTADQRRVVAALERNGMRARPFSAWAPGVEARWTWRIDGELRAGDPVPAELRPEIERVAALFRADAADDEALSLTLAQWCARHRVAPPVADMLRAPWAISAGAAPDAAAMVDVISSAEEHGGLAGMATSLSRVPVPGFGDLADAMGRELPDVVLGAIVTRVETGDGNVAVAAADGRRWPARAAVLALPVNVLPTIAFSPAPPPSVARVAGTSTGASAKLTVAARGVEPGAVAGGRGAGLDLLVADRRLDDGTTMLVGFGPRAELPAEVDDEAVARAVAALVPAAEVVRWAWHDWTADPFARGTWAATRPGDPAALHVPPPRLEGGVVLAGADVAPEAPGWVEGALASGEQTARDVLARLAPVPAR